MEPETTAVIDNNSDEERALREKLEACIAGNGKIIFQGPGRPKKGSTTLKLRDLGWTRQEAHEIHKMAQIPEELIDAFNTKRRSEGKPYSRRALLIHFGLKNVGGDDVFVDTPLGELAEALLEPTERVMKDMNDKERRWLVRAMRYRLKTIALMAELEQAEVRSSDLRERTGAVE